MEMNTFLNETHLNGAQIFSDNFLFGEKLVQAFLLFMQKKISFVVLQQ